MPNDGKLRRERGLTTPDDFYAGLMKAHAGLDETQGRLFDARLVLLLANHIGDDAVLAEALEAARAGVG